MSPNPVAWWRRGGTQWRDYRHRALRDDLLAAGVVSVLLIPQSLAYALLAGLPPQVGLYASLLPLLAYAALGTSPVLGIGPVAVLALMISQAWTLAPAGVTPQAAALVLAAEVGLLLALAALLRLHALAALLSLPVLHGFETGAALSIAVSQLPALVGAAASGSNLPDLLMSWWRSPRPWWPPTAVYGGVALLLLWLLRRYAVGWLSHWMRPAAATLLGRLIPLAVLIGAIALSAWTGAATQGVSLVGSLPDLALRLAWPPLDASLWWAMLPSAAPIALVAFVSSLVVAESLGRRQGSRIVPQRELAGLAAANLAASVSAGMPVAASFSRSVVIFDAGSRSRMTGAYTAALMAMAMWLLADVLAHLPRAVLAATIVVAVLTVLSWQPFALARRYAPGEWSLMLAVVALTLTVDVAWALGLGVAASIALLIQRTARPHLALIGRVPGTEHYRNVGRHETEPTPGVLSLRIDESLLFTNARGLGDVVMQQLADHRAEHPDTHRLVLMMAPVNRIDLSGLQALHDLHDALAIERVRLDLSEVKGPVLDALKAGDWTQWFRGRMFLSHHQAMQDHEGQVD